MFVSVNRWNNEAQSQFCQNMEHSPQNICGYTHIFTVYNALQHEIAMQILSTERMKECTRNTAIAEGPREALVSRNPATTKHLT